VVYNSRLIWDRIDSQKAVTEQIFRIGSVSVFFILCILCLILRVFCETINRDSDKNSDRNRDMGFAFWFLWSRYYCDIMLRQKKGEMG